jgi:predicted metallo-beta-lactamase superfamily hydrolase
VNAFVLGKIEVYPLADESMGARSMALGVVTPDAAILLDAGVSLAPRRFGLPPHPLEFQAAREARERITKFADRCDVVAVSHYHLDHYTPSFTSFYEWSSREVFERTYRGKLVLVKKPDSTVSFNQRRRAAAFLRDLGELGSRVLEADGKRFALGKTVVEALGPYPHGFAGPMGSVLAFMVRYGRTSLVYAPDVQGPVDDRAAEELAALTPTLLIVGGPPLYLEGVKIDSESVERGLRNLVFLAKVARLVVSHHTLRDSEWRVRLAEKGAEAVLTYTELAGVEEKLLEARRRELYRENPPPPAFERWLRSGAKTPPPL